MTYPDNITPFQILQNGLKVWINLRGKLFLILDIRIKFNTGPGTYDENTSVIAVITEDKRMIGIIVDLVDDVQRLDTNVSSVSEMGSAIPAKIFKRLCKT